MKKKNNKYFAALTAVFLCLALLITGLPQIMWAEESKEPVVELQEEFDETAESEAADIKQSEETNEEAPAGPDMDEPDVSPVDEETDQTELPKEEKTDTQETDSLISPIKPGINKTEKILNMDKLTAGEEDTNAAADGAESAGLTAQDIPAINENDPMYWMGQRTGGDQNRAMVWFGNYWQDINASKKSPVLWRTLRSDGAGNYGGAVTLLSEYALNTVYFDQNASYNPYWCNANQSIGSSDIRVWMNGVGTGAMDPQADVPSRYKGANVTYNNTGGGYGNKKGSFYANAFNENEKNLIIPTTLEGETGASGITGRTVTDKIFALSGISATSDVLSTVYFSNNTDRRCYFTEINNIQSNTITELTPLTNVRRARWWTRSPYSGWWLQATEVSATGEVQGSGANYGQDVGRPALNLNPTDIIFTSASSVGAEPLVTWENDSRLGLDISNSVASIYETDINGNTAYSGGAAYRIFQRSSEDSNLGISNGSSADSIAVSYQPGAKGQYINILAVIDEGEKWTGRVKHITDNSGGTVEFSLPQRTPGTSVERNIRVFAWRETEETETACIPNYQKLTVTEAASYKLTYENGGGLDGSSGIADQSVVQGSSCAIRPCTFKNGSKYFVGWQGSDGVMYSDQEIITPAQDLTLTAIWSDSYKTITYKTADGSSDDISYNMGTGSKVIFKDPVFTLPSGKEFMEWNTKPDGTGTAYRLGTTATLNDNLTLYAIYGTKATITYKANGGEGGDITQNGYLEKAFTLKSDGFTKTGSTLAGWNTDPEGGGQAYELGQSTELTASCTLYAQWTADSYTVSFNANGAAKGDAPDDLSLTLDEGAAIPKAELYRSKYTLAGWTASLDETGTVYKEGDTIEVNDSFTDHKLTLYAKWENADNYEVTYDMNKPAGTADTDVNGTMPASDKNCFNDGINTKTETPQINVKIKGYVFKGWSTSKLTPPLSPDLTAEKAEIEVKANVTYFAIWAPADQWTVTYSGKSEGITGDFPEDKSKFYDDGFEYQAEIKDNSQIRPGYTFAGWSKTEGAETADYKAGDKLKLNGSITLYSVWKINTCTVKYDRNAEKGSGDAPAGQSGTYGQKFTVSQAPEDMKNPGQKFMGWNTKADGSGQQYKAGQEYTFEQDLTLYAMWDNESYILIYNANCDDATNKAPASVTGTVASEIKAAEQGEMHRPYYKFGGWNTEADGSGDTIKPGDKISLNMNKTLYALWIKLSPMKVAYHSGCKDSLVDATLPKDTNEYYDDGVNQHEAVISTVKPFRYGYTFLSWNTQEDGKGTRYNGGEKVEMTGDLKLYAIWNMGDFTLQYNANAADVTGALPQNKYGNILSEIEIESGSGLTRPYYTFKEWNTKSDGTGLPYEKGEIINLGKDTTLYAQWEETEYQVTFDRNDPPISQAQGTLPNPIKGTHLVKFKLPAADLKCIKYKFTGWNTDPDGKGLQVEPDKEYQYKIFDEYGDKITLYAAWESCPPYELVYDKNAEGVTGDVPVDTNLYPPDDDTALATVQGPGNLKKKGYEFVCWSTKKDGSGSKYVKGSRFLLTAHTVLYAQWTPGTYILTYNKNGNDVTGKTPASTRISSQEDIKAAGPNTLKKKNYEFLGWSTKADAQTPVYKEGVRFRILENTTLYAVWRKLINVSFDHAEGLIPSANNYQSVSQGTKLGDIKLPAVKDGYEITGWVVNGEKVSDPENYVLSKDADVQAIVKKKPSADKEKKPQTDPKDENPDGDSGKPSENQNSNKNSNRSEQTYYKPVSGSRAATQANNTVYTKGRTKKADKASQKSNNKSAQTAPSYNGTSSAAPVTAAGSGNNIVPGESPASTTGNGFGPAGDCIVHWLLLLGMLINLIYGFLRTRHIRKKDLLDEDSIFDNLLPILPIPLCAWIYFHRACRLDLTILLAWAVLAVIIWVFIRRSYKLNKEQIENMIDQDFKN